MASDTSGSEADLEAQIRGLDEGRAVADLSGWWKTLAAGADASGWLNDLLAADLAGMAEGTARRSLLLSPTGRVRGDVTVCRLSEGFLLLQDPGQPEPVGSVLGPYVLSSAVTLEDRTTSLALVALPARPGPPGLPASWRISRPSLLDGGIDLLGPAEEVDAVRRMLLAEPSVVPAGAEALEAWRIRRGRPRFPRDLGTDSLPHETEVGEAVAYAKGCYLGQEAVARVRNLGHPPFVLLAMRADAPVSAGDGVVAGDREAGVVTSAAPLPGARETAVIARVRWDARDGSLRTRGGALLRQVRPAVIPPASSAPA